MTTEEPTFAKLPARMLKPPAASPAPEHKIHLHQIGAACAGRPTVPHHPLASIGPRTPVESSSPELQAVDLSQARSTTVAVAGHRRCPAGTAQEEPGTPPAMLPDLAKKLHPPGE